MARRTAWLVLAHLVDHGRAYLSVLVELAGPEGAPRAYSLPFYFLGTGIEYCLSALHVGSEVHFLVSRMDRETYVVRVDADAVLGLLRPLSPQGRA